MAQADPAETGQDGAGRRDTGTGTWRAGIRRAIRIGLRPGPWKRGLVLAALALLLGLLMLLHAKIPNRIGNLGSLVETFLSWFGRPRWPLRLRLASWSDRWDHTADAAAAQVGTDPPGGIALVAQNAARPGAGMPTPGRAIRIWSSTCSKQVESLTLPAVT